MDFLNPPQGLARLDELDRTLSFKSLAGGWILRKRAQGVGDERPPSWSELDYPNALWSTGGEPAVQVPYCY